MEPPPRQDNDDFLQRFFGLYYANRPQLVVDELAHREWMVRPFRGRLYRHVEMHGEDELRALLANRPPLDVYHSLACYTHPGTREMEAKHRGRQKWEVLIDIDVKPEPRLGASGQESLSEALDRARRQFVTTLQILERDLDLARGDWAGCFSGAKGFHARLTRPDLQQLSAEARREIGCLIGGHNVEIADLFPSVEPGKVLFPQQAPHGGLKRRLYLSMLRIRTMAAAHPRSPAMMDLCQRHSPAMADPQTILNRIRDTPSQALIGGQDDQGVASTWLAMAKHLACPSVDQSAIADASRMVRLQGSLNGKTGLLCKPLATIEEVEAFDPLTDANPHPRDVETRITGERDCDLAAGGQTYRVQSGEVAKIPLHIAIVFVATGGARLAEAPPVTYST